MTTVFDKKENCSGCGVCKTVCSENAVTMQQDNCGFYYPQIDMERCVSCGKCRSKCHFSNKSDVHDLSEEVFAVQSKDAEILKKSQSGGLFAELAKSILNSGASAPDNSWAGLFKGTIDGDYHVISNLEISNEEGKKSVSNDFAKGFIALSEGATVKNLGIDGLNVTTAGRAGGLIAFISGDTTVENCFVRNAVITGNKSGGIIGDVQAGKTVVVKDCYVIANVGLIGQNSSYETTTMERVYCGNDKGQFSQLPGTCKYAYRFRDASTPVTCWNDGEYKNSGITLEEALTNLGAAFAEDTMNQNSGYPVLAWENEKTTENGVLKVKSFDVSKTPDNEIQGTFLLKNYNIESKTAVIAIVLYGDDEEMLAVKIFESKNIPSGKSESAEVVFNGNEKAKKASLFVWDSLSEVNEIEYVRKDIEE